MNNIFFSNVTVCMYIYSDRALNYTTRILGWYGNCFRAQLQNLLFRVYFPWSLKVIGGQEFWRWNKPIWKHKKLFIDKSLTSISVPFLWGKSNPCHFFRGKVFPAWDSVSQSGSDLQNARHFPVRSMLGRPELG